MLNKEEADKLEMVIDLMIVSKDFSDEGVKGTLKFIHQLTEKPKRQIQGGDIYKTYEGVIVQIKLNNDSSYPFAGEGDSYTSTGIVCIGQCSEQDLDLSKRYKLVEVEDAHPR